MLERKMDGRRSSLVASSGGETFLLREEGPFLMAKRQALSRRSILILAAVLSIALFAAGLISGLAVSKIVEQQAQQRAQQEMTFFVDYVNKLDDELSSVQVQEAFVNSLDEKQRCGLADAYFSQVAKNLNYYWQRLPARLEAYEQGRELSPEYLQLKAEYTKLSLRAWLIARGNERDCHSDVRPVLYFYSADCADCVAQGEILDHVKAAMQMENQTVLPFTVDINETEPGLTLIREYYNVTRVPALIIDDHALQGRLFSEVEIGLAFAKGR
jgi:hypothetical protein